MSEFSSVQFSPIRVSRTSISHTTFPHMRFTAPLSAVRQPQESANIGLGL